MERIKVDTDLLKEKSKVFETSASVYAQSGKEILSFAASLPSYDGQLSGPARASALEINRQCQELHDCLLSDAQSLAKTAQAFEDVDNRAIDAFGASQASLSDYSTEYELFGTESDGGLPAGGAEDYAHSPFDRMVGGTNTSYYYKPEDKTIVIVYKGKFYTFPYDPNNPSVPPEPYRGIIEKIIHNCDDYTVATTNLEGDLVLAGLGLIPELGDVPTIIGILWTSLRECKIDWADIGSAKLIDLIKENLENLGEKGVALSEKLAPVLGTIAAIPGINKDFEALSLADNEAPSLQEIHKLCDPNNGVVISVKDDLYDHNGFSPAPEPQDPTSTPTPNQTPAPGGTPTVPTQTQTPEPAKTPTPTPTPP